MSKERVRVYTQSGIAGIYGGSIWLPNTCTNPILRGFLKAASMWGGPDKSTSAAKRYEIPGPAMKDVVKKLQIIFRAEVVELTRDNYMEIGE